MSVEKHQIGCENKLQTIANNFKDMGKALYSMGLIDRVEMELAGKEDISSFVIKAAIHNKEPNLKILAMIKDMILDGWKGISIKLSEDITNF